MINEEQAKKFTMAYISAYKTAIEEIRNPNFANQIAASVIMAMAMAEKRNQPEINPLEALFANIAKKVQQNEKSNNEEED